MAIPAALSVRWTLWPRPAVMAVREFRSNYRSRNSADLSGAASALMPETSPRSDEAVQRRLGTFLGPRPRSGTCPPGLASLVESRRRGPRRNALRSYRAIATPSFESQRGPMLGDRPGPLDPSRPPGQGPQSAHGRYVLRASSCYRIRKWALRGRLELTGRRSCGQAEKQT